MAKSLVPTYSTPQVPAAAQPYYGDYDSLAAQYLDPSNPYHPVHSVGQGLADVVGKLGEAYFKKQALDKAKAQESHDYSDVAKAYALAGTANPVQAPGGGIQSAAGSIGPNGDTGAAPYFETAGTPAASPQQVTQEAMKYLGGVNPKMAIQAQPGLEQIARAAAPQTFSGTLGPEQVAYVNNKPVATGGPPLPQSPEGKLLFDQKEGNLGPTDGSPNKVLAGALAKDQPVTWRAATAAEKQQFNIPSATSAQISSLGEIRALPKEAGQVGPAYDSNTGQPLGVVDYTDPKIAPKMASGEVLPHEPKVLQSADIDSLSKMGNMLQEYKQSLAGYKPEFSRIIGGDSKLRGFLGGKSFNEGADWFNHVNATFIQGTKDIAGRSPQLIEEYNKNRPESTDAPDVVTSKMNNLIRLQEQETARKASTYRRGGYLGQQIDQAVGFDTGAAALPGAGVQRAAQANAFGGGNAPPAPKVQKWTRDAQGNPVPSQ